MMTTVKGDETNMIVLQGLPLYEKLEAIVMLFVKQQLLCYLQDRKNSNQVKFNAFCLHHLIDICILLTFTRYLSYNKSYPLNN